jgi:hypothetical protein
MVWNVSTNSAFSMEITYYNCERLVFYHGTERVLTLKINNVRKEILSWSNLQICGPWTGKRSMQYFNMGKRLWNALQDHVGRNR